MKRFLTAAVLAVTCASANAGLIFSDNFDDYAGGGSTSALNYTNFNNKWTVDEGSVDLVANGGWNINCAGNSGKCIDLDGSSNNAGTFSSESITLSVGTYTLSFDMSGNQRNSANDNMLVSLGGFLNEDFNRLGNSGWETVVRTFTVTSETANTITFNHAGADNVGIMLDNVSLVSTSSGVTSVDEPTQLALIGLSLLGLGAARRKKKTK